MESIQSEPEQNAKAILEQLRDEADHSKNLEMFLDRTCVVVMQHGRQYLALACITCNCRDDLVNDADSVTINPLLLQLSALLGWEKIMIPRMCYLDRRVPKLG